MKSIFLLLLGTVFLATGCTYNVVQQQNGTRKGSQVAVVGGGEGRGVTAIQGTGSLAYPSTYPEYNGYPGSGGRYYYPRGYNGGYNGGYPSGYSPSDYSRIGPAYPPDPAGIPYPLPIPYSPLVHTELNLY